MSKTDARLDEWLKDVAPTSELRRWYGHAVARFEEFVRRYHAELGESTASEAAEHLLELGAAGDVVLLTATRDVAHSGAQVLLDHLTESPGP